VGGGGGGGGGGVGSSLYVQFIFKFKNYVIQSYQCNRNLTLFTTALIQLCIQTARLHIP